MSISAHTSRYFVASAVAALWLTACGGGDDPSPPAAPAPQPSPIVSVAGDMQLAANTSYAINAPNTSSLTVTLPPSAGLQINDTVSITGNSATRWTVALNPGQSILTSNLNGNVGPGAVWTPHLAPKVWHWISSDTTGQVLIAGEAAGGLLNVSSDGGQTWTSGDSVGGVWISSDMSATGDKMVAVQYGGGMYMSSNFGVTWTQVTDPLVNGPAGLNFESVTMSQDGHHLAAVIQADPATAPDGPLVLSNDGGTTWTAASLPPVVGGYFWRSIDSSADGQVIVAAEHNGQVFRSMDGGLTWSPLTITIGGAPVDESWYRLQISDDGQVIALVGNAFGRPVGGTGIYISRDGGANWTKPFSLQADYSAVAMSGDGQVITVSVSNPNPPPSASTIASATGRVLRSTDGGVNFSDLTAPSTDTDWRAVATSADGNKIALAAGLFQTNETGGLYTSLGNRTSIGSAGAITGGQNMSVQLQYLGNGQWSVPASTGGPFTIE